MPLSAATPATASPTVSPSTSTDPLAASTPSTTSTAPGANVVDGVTPDNGGGREEGDVELALFRRIRSISNMSGRLTSTRSILPLPSPTTAGYRRYFQHPLSMFSPSSSSATEAPHANGPLVADVDGGGNESADSDGKDLVHAEDATNGQRDDIGTSVLGSVSDGVVSHGAEREGRASPDNHNQRSSRGDRQALFSDSRKRVHSNVSTSTTTSTSSSASRHHSSSDDPSAATDTIATSTTTNSITSATPTLTEPSLTSPRVEADLHAAVSTGVAWRDALVHACTTLLGKPLADLQRDYAAATSATNATATATATTFRPHGVAFEPTPRDLADFVIISTLKQQDAHTMQNAASWLFNMMDRTGAGYVLRDEFVRYAPFIGPVADFAVAGIVFDELIQEQVRLASDATVNGQSGGSNGGGDSTAHGKKGVSRKSNAPFWMNENQTTNSSDSSSASRASLRQRRPTSGAVQSSSVVSTSDSKDNGTSTTATQVTKTKGPSGDLYPPAAALRFDIWRRFFHAVQDKHHYIDEDWTRVKREVGIDPDETLIKSQGALDHSDVFPTLGKLYLSQRYLIFFAAVGRNHYVVRLGAVADVTTDSIPIMMRDCLRVMLESEAKAAMDGVSAVVKPPLQAVRSSSSNRGGGGGGGGSGGNDERDGNGRRRDGSRREETTSEHIGKLMRQFTAGRKPLLFSLLEFRETKRRDNWVTLVREMVAAHKLHVQLGFGSSGRAVRSVQQHQQHQHRQQHQSPPAVSGHPPAVAGKKMGDVVMRSGTAGGHIAAASSVHNGADGGGNGMEDDCDVSGERRHMTTQNYARSPFRNEPSAPLLVVAAHGNLVRYRALRRATGKRVSNNSLMVFSHGERNAALVNWYTDSVRAYESRSGRTWIERALKVIRENMETNERIYQVEDDEPFDVGKLGDAIGRFAELCAPLVRVMQFFDHLVQWRNPPATILALLVCVTIAMWGLVAYVPAMLVVVQAAWVVETRYNWLGIAMGGGEEGADADAAAAEERRNVLELVAQVHDALAAGQNVLLRLNRELGKVQAVFLWGTGEEGDSWVTVGALCGVAVVLAVVSGRVLFLIGVLFLFFKHFMPPSNAVLVFWQGLPSRIVVKRRR